MTASTPFNYWANNIFAGSKISYRHFTSCLTSYSHCIVTHHYHHHIIPHHHNQPSLPSLPPHHLRSSSCTHLVLHIHICSVLKEAADRFEMFILTGQVKRSSSPLHPPPPYNKHNINSTTVWQSIHHHKHTTQQLSMHTMATTNTI
jgi:hypothetical protein